MKKHVVNSAWLHNNLKNPNLIVLDASLKENQASASNDFENIQIKNARFFDIKNSFSDTADPLPNAVPSYLQFKSQAQKLGINSESILVVYDALGVYSSPRVWWLFKLMGHQEVYVLDGGLPEWIKQNYPVETPLKNPIYSKGNFECQDSNSDIRTKEQVLENISTKEALLIDARIEKRFQGIGIEPRPGLRSGHIPGAINIPYTKIIQNGKFVELNELIQILVPSQKPLIFNCGSGVTACIVLLAYELVYDNPTSIYDGSWSEWGQLEHLPIEK